MHNHSESNIFWHKGKIEKTDRQRSNGHKSACVWFTGLSGSGKSSIALKVEEMLFEKGIKCYVLDGDNIRHGLNNDLGFSADERNENIRRVGEVAKLFIDAGLIILTAFISPYRIDRDSVRNKLAEDEFIEVFIDADMETCEARDPKGLYKKARAGEIKDFTGISSVYEKPLNPELMINTTLDADIERNAKKVIDYLLSRDIIQNY